MADSYVCSGAKIRCTMGTAGGRLTVLPYPVRTVLLTGKPQANTGDHEPNVNISSFGRCCSLAFPPTAIETEEHDGVLTPMPCQPNTGAFLWMGGKNDYILQGKPALLKSCKCQCFWGGIISFETDGQVDTGAADLTRIQTDEFEKDQVSAEGLSPEEILDGIQMALDVAGMVPLFGAVPDVMNAAISIYRGNWVDAAMSLVAAVPGIGDVAGGTKIAKNGVKIANKNADHVISLAEKRVGKVERQMAESDNVLKFPEQKAANTTVEKSVGMQEKDTLARIDQYKVEKIKQGNGPEITVIEKVTDSKPVTVNNSVGGVGGGTNSSPSGFYHGQNVQDVRSGRGVGSTTEKPKESIFNNSDKTKKNFDDSNVLNMEEYKKKRLDFNG